jgi:PEP-CTERM motif
MKLRLISAAVLALASSASMAQALTITTAPGQASFQAYLSDDLFVDTPEAINSGDLFASFADPKNYLLFMVNTMAGAAPVFSAMVDIAGTGYQFHNGLTSISTTPSDASHWQVATRWDGLAPEPAGSCTQAAPCNVISGLSTISWNTSVPSAAPYVDASSGNQFAIYSVALQQVSPVPEPQAYALAIVGLGMMGLMARRRKQSQG